MNWKGFEPGKGLVLRPNVIVRFRFVRVLLRLAGWSFKGGPPLRDQAPTFRLEPTAGSGARHSPMKKREFPAGTGDS